MKVRGRWRWNSADTAEMLLLPVLHLLLYLSSWTWVTAASASHEEAARGFFDRHASSTNSGASTHTNNWAVLVCSSRYWFNYRVSFLDTTMRIALK